ncbi:MAG: hypothetical protein HY794_18155 [Desulfarculus sp.]|nr:hypothetical protein [Desulfarculus sp.]
MPHEINPGRSRPQTTVYASPPEADWLKRHGASMAGQLREDIATLRNLGRAPALSEAEVNCLRDVLNSHYYTAELARSLPVILAAEVEDSAPDGLAEKWGVDLEALAARLRALHPADAWALLEQVRMWWGGQRG